MARVNQRDFIFLIIVESYCKSLELSFSKEKFNQFQTLDIKLKWPNDIYANSDVKIGGLIVTSVLEGDLAICNIGE